MTHYKDIAKNTHKKVLSRFKYLTDEKQYDKVDEWRSHLDAVLGNENFSDDCDGFALTCADFLAYTGIGKGKIRLVICYTETGEGHLVCTLDDSEVNDTYVLDNRMKSIKSWNKMKGYKWVKYCTLNDVHTWYKF